MIVKLGRDVVLKKDTFINIDREGVGLILGMTRTGKSSILMNILIKIAKYRQVIIFSYGDEYNNMIYSNCFSINADSLNIKKTVLIDRIKIKPSELNQVEHWIYLGMPYGAAVFLSDLAKNVSLHHDIPEIFFECVARTPTTLKRTQENALHEQSLISILRSKNEVMSFMSTESIDWEELVLSRKNIIINLNLTKEQKTHAQFLVGFILNKIKQTVWRTKPLIAFEEADILINKDDVSFSGSMIGEYNLKMQKAGIFMILVAQQDYKLPRSIEDNAVHFIFGKMTMQGDSYLSRMVNTIKWEHGRNYREFVYYSVVNNVISKFVPEDVPNFIHRR